MILIQSNLGKVTTITATTRNICDPNAIIVTIQNDTIDSDDNQDRLVIRQPGQKRRLSS